MSRWPPWVYSEAMRLWEILVDRNLRREALRVEFQQRTTTRYVPGTIYWPLQMAYSLLDWFRYLSLAWGLSSADARREAAFAAMAELEDLVKLINATAKKELRPLGLYPAVRPEGRMVLFFGFEGWEPGDPRNWVKHAQELGERLRTGAQAWAEELLQLAPSLSGVREELTSRLTRVGETLTTLARAMPQDLKPILHMPRLPDFDKPAWPKVRKLEEILPELGALFPKPEVELPPVKAEPAPGWPTPGPVPAPAGEAPPEAKAEEVAPMVPVVEPPAPVVHAEPVHEEAPPAPPKEPEPIVRIEPVHEAPPPPTPPAPEPVASQPPLAAAFEELIRNKALERFRNELVKAKVALPLVEDLVNRAELTLTPVNGDRLVEVHSESGGMRVALAIAMGPGGEIRLVWWLQAPPKKK